MRRDSGVGAGIDSYYEYLLKAYVLLGDEGYLERFNKVRMNTVIRVLAIYSYDLTLLFLYSCKKNLYYVATVTFSCHNTYILVNSITVL